MTPSFKSLRYTTAIAVSLVALSTANQANAQCVGSPVLDCTGSTTSIVSIAGGSTVTDLIVNAGADITVAGTATSILNAANVDNAGTISGTIGLQHVNAIGATIINSGTIRSTAGSSTVDAIVVDGGTYNIINTATGTIENLTNAGSSNRAIQAITGGGSGATLNVTNAGTISTVRSGATAIFGDSIGNTAGTLDNQAGGMIITVGIANAVQFFGGNDTVTNNAGATITGDISSGAGNDTITNSGNITGRVLITAGSDTITNSAAGVIENPVTSSGVFTNNAIRITGGDLAGGIDNDGRITTSLNPAIAIDGTDVTGLIDNSGTIEGTEPGGSGVGISVLNAGSDISGGIINQAGGSITGTLTAIDVGQNADISGGITNFGEIDGAGFTGIGAFVSADISGGVTNEVGGVIRGNTGIAVGSSGFSVGAISGGITNRGTIEGTGGTAIDLSGTLALTPITIDGGRIIGNVTDNTLAVGRSPVMVTGSGFKTEGNFTVSDLVVNAGQDFTISSDNVVTLNDMSASAGVIKFELGASSVAQLNVTGAGNDIDITAANIEAVNNDRSFSLGDSILIGTGMGVVNAGAGLAPTDVVDNLTFFDLQVADGASGGVGTNEEVYLLVSAASNPCDGQFSFNPDGPCETLATLTGTTNQQLLDIINNTGGSNAEDILNATLPQVDGSNLAATQNVTGNTLRIVSDRLTTIRSGGDGSGISSGDLTETLQVWGQGFAQTINQGQRDTVAGFDADTFGFTVGADTEDLIDKSTVGIAFTYANTDVDSDSVNNTQTDVDSYNISAYADYDIDERTYVIGSVGYTYGDNEATRFNVGGIAGLNANSDYSSHQFEARVIGARDYHLEQYKGVKITPKAQVHYVRFDAEDISESGAGGVNLNIDSDALNILEFGVGVDARKDYVQNNGAILSPEISAGYRYDVVGDAINTTSTFEGGGPAFQSEGADPAQGTLNLGLGLGYTTIDNWELTASYDYETKSDFNSHSGLVRAAYKF